MWHVSKSLTTLVVTGTAIVLVNLAVGCDTMSEFGGPSLPTIERTRDVPDSGLSAPRSAASTPDPVGSSAEGSPPDYDRSEFEHWSDLDDDGCNTREEVLLRDAEEFTRGTDGCVDEVVVIGPYTGETLTGRSAIDVDHVVALSDAWYSGAWKWTDERRELFANNLGNLLAVQDNENASKGGDGPDEWRPPRRDFWCEYGTIYLEIKREWHLRITPEERRALWELIATC